MGCCEDDKVHAKNEAIHGPVSKRGCTDVIFIPIYLAVMSFLVYILIRATKEGNLDLLLHGTDSYGNICGKNNSMIEGVPQSGADMTDYKNVLIKLENYTTPESATVVLLRRKQCIEKCHRNHTEILNRCISVNLRENRGALSDIVSAGSDFLQDAGEDAERCWRDIVYLVIIGLLLSVVLLILLRFVSGIIIWTILFAVIICCIAGTAVLWIKYKTKKDLLDELGTLRPRYMVHTVNLWLAAAIVVTVVTVIILLIILVLRKRIALVIALFQEASKAIIKMPFLLFLPFLTFLFISLFFAMWFLGLVYIVSAREPIIHPDGTVKYVIKEFFKKIRLYHLFVMIWNVQFLIACQHMVVAGAVCKWYFTKNKSNIGTPISSSLLTMVRYHLGSTLFGSILIAIVKLIRFLLKKFQHSISNTYAEICIYGDNFCISAKRALAVMTNNILRIFAINSVGDFVLFLSKIGLTLATFFIGLELVRSKEDSLNYSWLPGLIGAIFVYLIALAFLSVYEMTIDTIFVCFCEDCEQNNGEDKPYYMSKGLMVFVNNCKQEMAITQEINKDKMTAPKMAPVN